MTIEHTVFEFSDILTPVRKVAGAIAITPD
jgi:hypothetical protein